MKIGGFLGRLAIVALVVMQAPFMVTKSGTTLSPIQIATKFIVDNAHKDGGELTSNAQLSLRVANWPGHMYEQCVHLPAVGMEGNCDAMFVWESAISHATKPMTFWATLAEDRKQLLFAGCAMVLFGAIISLLSGRTHLLSVLGSGMLAYAIFQNGMFPTFQLVVASLIALAGLRSRTGGTLTTPGAAAPAAATTPGSKRAQQKKKD